MTINRILADSTEHGRGEIEAIPFPDEGYIYFETREFGSFSHQNAADVCLSIREAQRVITGLQWAIEALENKN